MRFLALLLSLLAFLLLAPVPAHAAPPPQKPPTPGKLATRPAAPAPKPAPAGHRPNQRPAAKKEEESEEEMPDDGEDEGDDGEGEDPENPDGENCEESEEDTAEEDSAEEEETPAKNKKAASSRENYFAGLWKGVTGQRNAALSALQDENQQLKAEIAALRKENRRQARQLAHIDENWPAIEAALTQGKPEAGALQTKLGKKVAATVMKTAAHQMKSAGHNPSKLPGPGSEKSSAQPPAAGAKSLVPAFGTPEFAAVSDSYWSSRQQTAAN